MDDIRICMASGDDAAELLAIYRPYVEETAITFEYTVPTVEELRGRICHTLARFPYLKAVCDGQAAGYAYVSPFRTRAAYQWSVETSIYVRQDCRGRGVGTALYQTLEEILRRQGIRNLYAGITDPNPASQALHHAFGYRTVARYSACGYKLDRWHDVIWMEKFLVKDDTAPQPVIPVDMLDLCDVIKECL